MSEKEEKSNKLEIKIPVFSVLRNGRALKNIFLTGPNGEIREEYEDMPVRMGRHPDNHITLDHPSISRFHIEIFVKPSIQKISIVDRASVHGTWVSGTKIEPNIPVDIMEGDVLRLGTSTREYRLQWLSLDEAYEMENPLPPIIEEKEEAHQVLPIIQDYFKDFFTVFESHLSTWLLVLDSNLLGLALKEEEICQEVLADQHEVTTNGVREKDNSLESENLQQIPVKKEIEDTGLESGPVLTEPECLGTIIRDAASSLLIDSVGTHPISEEICQEVLANQYEVTTNGVHEEDNSLELKNLQQIPVRKEIADTGLDSGPVLTEPECIGTINRDAASSLLIDSVSTHPISEQASPDSESNESVIRGTCASLASGMLSEPVPPGSESVGSILRATASSLILYSSNTGPTSEPAPPVSESVKSIRKGTPSSLLSRRSKSKYVSSLSIQTGVTNVKAPQEEPSSNLCETSGAKEVELEDEEIFESDKENMTPVSSYANSNKAARKAVDNYSKLETQVLARKGVKKTTETLCVSGKSNLNDGTVSLSSREILPGAKENESCASTKAKEIPKLLSSGSVKKSRKKVRILGETMLSDKSSSKVLLEKENSCCARENGALQVSVSKSAEKSEEMLTLEKTKQIARSAAQVLFENCGEDEIFSSDKENVTPIYSSNKNKYKPVSESPGRALFQSIDVAADEEGNYENFASDKENWTPNPKLAQKWRWPLSEDHDIVEISGRKEAERVPFHVLFDNNVQVSSNSPLRPLGTIPDKSSACGPQQQLQREKAKEPRKEWIMVIDTGCLLGEESIKAIKLLQGLRGTRLIIPRIVIRELDCMKRCERLFKRSNKQASLVLEWIEECMEKEPLWIHVQSSSEALPVPPTPPITPTSLFGDVGVDPVAGVRSDLNAIFSPRGTYMEIVTPTSDDHVLECALLFKKLRGDEAVVLLSSSTTLKIKAMAEGLLCEEAKDFKNSLTNPFSKRFMWASGSLRGPTWQSSGDAAATANNEDNKDSNPVIARRSLKAAEAIKGLKLILLHNSHYAQTSLVN